MSYWYALNRDETRMRIIHASKMRIFARLILSLFILSFRSLPGTQGQGNCTYPYPVCNLLHTVNDEKLAELKFGESANKSVWRKKVWRIHPELQAYIAMYGY